MHLNRSAFIQASCLGPATRTAAERLVVQRLAHRFASLVRPDHTGLGMGAAPCPAASGLSVHGAGVSHRAGAGLVFFERAADVADTGWGGVDSGWGVAGFVRGAGVM